MLIRPYQRPYEGNFRRTVARYHCGFLHDSALRVYFAWYLDEKLDLLNLQGPLQGFIVKAHDLNYHLGMVSMRRIARLTRSSQYVLVVPKRLADNSKNQGYRKLLKTARDIQNLLGSEDENQTE